MKKIYVLLLLAGTLLSGAEEMVQIQTEDSIEVVPRDMVYKLDDQVFVHDSDIEIIPTPFGYQDTGLASLGDIWYSLVLMGPKYITQAPSIGEEIVDGVTGPSILFGVTIVKDNFYYGAGVGYQEMYSYTGSYVLNFMTYNIFSSSQELVFQAFGGLIFSAGDFAIKIGLNTDSGTESPLESWIGYHSKKFEIGISGTSGRMYVGMSI